MHRHSARVVCQCLLNVLIKDKDADENVDADQTRTGKLVSGQPTGLFTQLEEIDIDFRVSGLPHAVVWVQKLLNDQRDKLFNNLKVPNQTNQIQTQIMVIERGHPLFAVTQVTRKVQDKHVHLMTARASTLKITQNMIEQ